MSEREFSHPQVISISEVRGGGELGIAVNLTMKTGPSHPRPWRHSPSSGRAERPPRRASRGVEGG